MAAIQSELEINMNRKEEVVTPHKSPKQRKRINRVPLGHGFHALRLLSSSLLFVFPDRFELRQYIDMLPEFNDSLIEV